LLYDNQFPQKHYLKVSLRGRHNRLGVGARLTATLPGGRKLVREMFPLNSFRSAMPNLVHFGLGDATRVARLHIRWPSGEEQELSDLAGDRHIMVTQGRTGKTAVETVVPGRPMPP
jgi:hypothetical protein